MSDSHISDKVLINQMLGQSRIKTDQLIRKDMALGDAESRIRAMDREKKELEKKNAALASENDRLRMAGDALLKDENERLRKESGEKDIVIARQKELLRQWMVSQTAFKNLFKKYGKLPDGRPASEISTEERVAMVENEEKHVVETGDGITTEATRKAIMGGEK